MRIVPFALLCLLACSDDPAAGDPAALEDSRYPTGSSSLISSHDYRAHYAVHPEAGSVSRIDAGLMLFTEIQLGGEPTRLARAGDVLFVTLKRERSIAVLRDTGAELVELERLATGNEPYGIVASEDGTKLYVAQALSGRVTEFDVATRTATRFFSVPDQPRWLALHPGGRGLYVGSAMRGTLSWIDLANDEVESMQLPEIVDRRFDQRLQQEVVVPFSRRITGDLAISPDGRDLYVPALYVDNTTSVLSSGVMPNGDFEGSGMPFPSEPFPGGGGGGGYASAGPNDQRFNPGVVEVPLDAEGLPRPDLATTVSARLDNNPFAFSPVGYITSVTVAPDGDLVYATMEGANTVVAIDRRATAISSAAHIQETQGEQLLDVRRRAAVQVGLGPRAVSFGTAERAVVLNAFSQDTSRLSAQEIAQATEQSTSRGAQILGSGGTFRASSLLPTPELMMGRQLFYAAMDHRMAQPGAGVSCATCHNEGRNDGLSWPLENGPRQTPLLAGGVSDRQPVTWTETVPTVAHEVMLTSQGRMGGFGLGESEAQLVAAYLDSVVAPDTPNKGEDNALIRRGEELFNDPVVGCGECHTGVALTDHRMHELYALNVRTRSLTGLAASAPYLHDGSADTLDELVDNLRGMGTVSHLDAADRAALVAYLESL